MAMVRCQRVDSGLAWAGCCCMVQAVIIHLAGLLLVQMLARTGPVNIQMDHPKQCQGIITAEVVKAAVSSVLSLELLLC